MAVLESSQLGLCLKASLNREKTVVKGLRRSGLPPPCSQECYLLGFYSLRSGVVVLFRGRFWRHPPSAICVNFKSRTLGSRCEFLQRRTWLLAVYRNGDWERTHLVFVLLPYPEVWEQLDGASQADGLAGCFFQSSSPHRWPVW